MEKKKSLLLFYDGGTDNGWPPRSDCATPFIPTFNVPLRLIYSNDLKRREQDDFSSFQFSIGLTF